MNHRFFDALGQFFYKNQYESLIFQLADSRATIRQDKRCANTKNLILRMNRDMNRVVGLGRFVSVRKTNDSH